MLDISESSDFSTFIIEELPILAPNTSYTATGLVSETTYYYRVKAVTEPAPFIFTINTANTSTGSTTDTQFKLPLTTSDGLNIEVDWGDGSIDTITDHTAPEVTHTYATAGEYTISTKGDLLGWQFANGGDKLKMLDVKQWAGLNISVTSGFYGCTNLTASATDTPIITSTSLSNLFRNCTNFNGAIGNWDVSSVTNMFAVFGFATSFNQDISSWNVSNVTVMESMFESATSFNQNIGSWNTSSVSVMTTTFRNATSFNQEIGNWDTSSVTNMTRMFEGATSFNNLDNPRIKNWDVSSVTLMYNMFRGAISFNQPIGIWNTSSVTRMDNMFNNADAFDQDISGWDINQVSDFSNFMLSATGFPVYTYQDLLIGWEANLQAAYPGGVGYPYTGAISIDFGGSFYFPEAEIPKQSLIDNFGWTITDGGPQPMIAEYQAVLDYATTQGYVLPSASNQALQNKLIYDLKDAGMWETFDAFSMFATDGNADFALIDWKRVLDYTNYNNCVFTENKGFIGNGSSSYIDTKFTPSTDAVNYQTADAGMSIHLWQTGTNGKYLIGNESYIAPGIRVRCHTTSSQQLDSQFNDNLKTRSQALTTNIIGHYHVDRLPNYSFYKFHMNSYFGFGNTLVEPIGLPASTTVLFRYATIYADQGLSYFIARKSRTTEEIITMNSIISNYLDAI